MCRITSYNVCYTKLLRDTKEIEKEMEDSVNEVKKHRNNVIWIAEMLPKNEVIQLYSHADVFCCP